MLLITSKLSLKLLILSEQLSFIFPFLIKGISNVRNILLKLSIFPHSLLSFKSSIFQTRDLISNLNIFRSQFIILIRQSKKLTRIMFLTLIQLFLKWYNIIIQQFNLFWMRFYTNSTPSCRITHNLKINLYLYFPYE